jgi:hypothetical protein
LEISVENKVLDKHSLAGTLFLIVKSRGTEGNHIFKNSFALKKGSL